MGENLANLHQKRYPLLSQILLPKKPRARHGNKLNYLISHIGSVIAVQIINHKGFLTKTNLNDLLRDTYN